MRLVPGIIALAMFSLLLPPAGLADPEHPADSSCRLCYPGIEPAATATLDWVSNLSGGVKRGSRWLAQLETSAALDSAELGLWSGGAAFVDLLFAQANLPSELTGDLQGIDNRETDRHFAFLQAWYEHTFWNKRLSLLAGLHDLNSDFALLSDASLLINSSFGISPEISQYASSLFPRTTAGFRAKALLPHAAYLLSGIYDGEPGLPENSNAATVHLSRAEGAFWINELGFSGSEQENADKIAAGGWLHTARREDFKEHEHNRNIGAYVIAQHNLGALLGSETGIFFQFGWADPERSDINAYTGAGIRAKGFSALRPEDQIALAFNHARLSGEYRDCVGNSRLGENVAEFTYAAALAPHITLQPDLQYIHNPGAARGISDALALILRLQVSL